MISPERAHELIHQLEPYVSMVCETQLLDFNARAGYGPYLKLRFENPALLKGFKQGQRFHIILIKITEDDMPATANPEDRKAYKLSQKAGMFCSQEDFRHWITQVYGEPCHNKDQAAEWVRKACNIPSRSLLDSDETAAETFNRILEAFDSWKQGAGDE